MFGKNKNKQKEGGVGPLSDTFIKEVKKIEHRQDLEGQFSSVSFLVNVENTFYVDYFCGKNEPNFSSKTFHHFSEDGNRNSFQFKIVCIFERHVNTQRENFRRQIELTPRQRQQQHRPQRQRRRQRWLG